MAYRIRVRLEGAGDHFFISESAYPDEHDQPVANAQEFLGYLRENYPDLDIDLEPITVAFDEGDYRFIVIRKPA